jgi:hypothetical protein
MSEFVQVNLSLKPEIVETMEALGKENGWSKAQTVAVAVRALAKLMEQHEYTASQARDDARGELFRKVARELPAELVDLKDGIKLARLKTKRPAVLLDDWTITSADDGELVGLQPRPDGGFRMATIADGAIRVKATWSQEEARAALAATPS